MKLSDKIFSIKNNYDHKVYTVLGIKVKIKLPNAGKKVISRKKMAAYIEQIKFILDSCCDITQCKPAKGNFRRVQNFRAKVLKFLLGVFEENNIKYWADGGTLLGAYRHKGFVPWDDDIDIATDRENYNKMLEVFPKVFENTGLSFDFGKDRTGFYMKIFYQDFDITDVFVYDYSNNQSSRDELYEIWKKSRDDFYVEFPKKSLWAGEIKIEDANKHLTDYYKRDGLVLENGESNKWIFKGFDAATKNLTCNIFAVDDIFPLKKVVFEDLELYAPKNLETYLSTVNSSGYGDFMSFPPLTATHFWLSDEYDSEEFLERLVKLENDFDELIKNKAGMTV